MPQCPSCATELADSNRFCPGCGTPVIPGSEAATAALSRHRQSSPSSSSLDEGRFPAGTVLDGRYRILSLLGRGGMGEVYRANDLKLSQPVSIKFLSEETAANERMLARFHSEVRIARQVTHPNVCRVYDIGEYQGSTYITMEYVDGEDLASLLRRIGRLPGDKATEIARKLCAGLAAAHNKGILHRDLKPANIMVDGRGHVLIADFGLAGLAGQVEGGEIRNGTPAYMAPEQLAGREVSVRSDIYALGLVLYEMFTGKRCFEDPSRRITPTSVSTLAKDIDPAVERLILRCLDEDPRVRPQSALAVAAALPGADPLAAALAAGETPSPEMVAAAGETDAISVGTALLCAGAVVAGLTACILFGSQIDLVRRMPLDRSPEILTQKARDLIQSFGYTGHPADSAAEIYSVSEYQRYAARRLRPAEFLAQLARGQPNLLHLTYRQSPQYLAATNALGYVQPFDPPEDVTGMVRLQIDTLGRLIFFRAVPPQVDPTPAASAAPDPGPLFAAAGLDSARFTPAQPQWTPLAASDFRAAWTGVYPDAPDLPLRLEAAWWRGKLVDFEMISPWTEAARDVAFNWTDVQASERWIVIVVCSVCLAAALLARHNFRLGRGDTRGASRLAVFMFFVSLVGWLLAAHHVPTIEECSHFTGAMSDALLVGAMFWVLYLALEPYVRRRWPQSLISWSRLLAGGFRDPLVGGQVLIGIAVGLAVQFGYLVASLLSFRSGDLPSGYLANLQHAMDLRHLIDNCVFSVRDSIQDTLFVFALFFLLRLLLRRGWAAALVCGVLFDVPIAIRSSQPLATGLIFAPLLALILFTLIRFGVLPLLLTFFVSDVFAVPIATDLSTWYAGGAILAVVTILALSAYAFHIARAGRPLLKADLLEY